MLNRLNHLAKPQMKIFFSTFSQLDFYVVHQGDWSIVVGLVMCDVIEVDQVGLMGTEKIFVFQAVFNLLQDTRKHERFTISSNNLGIPAVGNATKNLFHPENFDSPGGFNCYFR